MRMDENDENAAPSGGYAAVNLLVENNESDAEDYGSIIDAFNQDRKSIDRHVTQEAHEIIESNPELKKPQEHGHLQSQVDEGASSASSRRA